MEIMRKHRIKLGKKDLVEVFDIIRNIHITTTLGKLANYMKIYQK